MEGPAWAPSQPGSVLPGEAGSICVLTVLAAQESVRKEEKSGSGQSPTQGTPKKEDPMKSGKGSKCWCPFEAPLQCRGRAGGGLDGRPVLRLHVHFLVMSFRPHVAPSWPTALPTLFTKRGDPQGTALRRGPSSWPGWFLQLFGCSQPLV